MINAPFYIYAKKEKIFYIKVIKSSEKNIAWNGEQ